MTEQLTINLHADPELREEIERMRALVPNADVSHVVAAAVRYFSESSAQYEREVYIREQLEFEAQLASVPEATGTGREPTVKSGYTDHEWTQLAEAIVQAPLNLTLNVGQPGMIKTIKEVAALASGIKALSKDKYKDNRLIQGLLADFKQVEQSMRRERLSYDEALAVVKAAAQVVDRVASADEARRYKQFIVDVTDHVANAAGEGFMGSGEKVSQAEIDYIDALKTTFGVP